MLAPIGYVIQDTVADAMTVEAVPRVDEHGNPIGEAQRKLMHTTMQTLGRVAIIGGSVLVALINLYVFSGVQDALVPNLILQPIVENALDLLAEASDVHSEDLDPQFRVVAPDLFEDPILIQRTSHIGSEQPEQVELLVR